MKKNIILCVVFALLLFSTLCVSAFFGKKEPSSPNKDEMIEREKFIKDLLSDENKPFLKEFPKRSDQDAIVRTLWEKACNAKSLESCTKIWDLLLEDAIVQKAWKLSPDYLFDFAVNWSKRSGDFEKLPQWNESQFIYIAKSDLGRYFRQKNGEEAIIECLKANFNDNLKEDRIKNLPVSTPRKGKCKKLIKTGMDCLRPSHRWLRPDGKTIGLPSMYVKSANLFPAGRLFAIMPREMLEECLTKENIMTTGQSVDFVYFVSPKDGMSRVISLNPGYLFRDLLARNIWLIDECAKMASRRGERKFIGQIDISEATKLDASLEAEAIASAADVDFRLEKTKAGLYRLEQDFKGKKTLLAPREDAEDALLRQFREKLDSPNPSQKIVLQKKLSEEVHAYLGIDIRALGFTHVKGKLSYDDFEKCSIYIEAGF